MNAGSMNFGRGLFPNTPDTMELYAQRMRQWGVMPEFEVYDLSMIQNMEHWIRKPGLLEPPFRVSFVLGVMGGIPASLKNLVLLKDALDPSYSWQAIGIGRHQFPLGTGALILGGGMRVGFEDTSTSPRECSPRATPSWWPRRCASPGSWVWNRPAWTRPGTCFPCSTGDSCN